MRFGLVPTGLQYRSIAGRRGTGVNPEIDRGGPCFLPSEPPYGSVMILVDSELAQGLTCIVGS
jgi:hypothetical protein